jgi:DNA-binding NarL/FixJ family response regulator
MKLADYQKVTALKNIIINMKLLEDLSSRGDGVAMAIMVDLKLILGYYGMEKTMLSTEQVIALRMNLIEGYTQFEVAETLNVSQRTISNRVKEGLKVAKKQLLGGVFDVCQEVEG